MYICILVFHTHISISYRSLQECGAFRNIFFRSVNQSPTSILISATSVYCTSRADAHQDFLSLTPIINHRSVISRLMPLRGEQTFVRLKTKKKKERSDRHFDPNIEAARNLCRIVKANLTERYGEKFMYAVEMNAKIPARQDPGTFRRWM